MAIRKTREENFSLTGNSDVIKGKVKNALNMGRFSNIKENNILNQFTADYKKFSVWGSIVITLCDNDEKINMNVKATANADNIFALFSSPTQKILNAFKNNL